MNRILIGICIALALLSALLWRGRDNALAELATFKAAQKEATAKAIAARKAEEKRLASHAERIDREHKTELANAMDAADAYIRANRVRCEAGTASGTIAATPDRDTGVSEGMPATGVLVSEGDVQACSAATAYALKAREWALGLNE